MQYNELGQEIERILPGDVISKWQYDITGRPTHHRISSQNRDTRRRVYNWDVSHRLRSMVNELTGVKVTYGYDEFSNLVWANQDSKFDFLYSSVDDVGNLYETTDKKIKSTVLAVDYLKQKMPNSPMTKKEISSRKLKTMVIRGSTSTGNGMLSKVIKPDKSEVTFKYDSLGRRIEKRSDEKTMRFVWDGNTILHEFDSQNDSVEDNLVTWVFNDGFVPSAKITGEGHFSIISDYLGTPVEAYDEQGNKVWSAELDIYGRVKGYEGEKDFVPFRYQGQYSDEETGLYYNRFRYYSPEEGMYTQQDPIRLNSRVYNFYQYVSNSNNTVDPFGLDWHYRLIDSSGNAYYHGRASDNASMFDVGRRHAATWADGYRFGAGDKFEVVTPKGTDYDTVRGIEERGIQQKNVLGRQNPNVRGNKIHGISEAKQSTIIGERRLMQLISY